MAAKRMRQDVMLISLALTDAGVKHDRDGDGFPCHDRHIAWRRLAYADLATDDGDVDEDIRTQHATVTLKCPLASVVVTAATVLFVSSTRTARFDTGAGMQDCPTCSTGQVGLASTAPVNVPVPAPPLDCPHAVISTSKQSTTAIPWTRRR